MEYIIDVLIETSQTSNIKYEYDSDYNCMRCKKIMDKPIPFNFGFIPNTDNDDSPVDIILISEEYPFIYNIHTIVEVRIIGLLTMKNNKNEEKNIVIVIPSDNITSKYKHIEDINHIDNSILYTIISYWDDYKDHLFKKAIKGLNYYEKYIVEDSDSSV